LKRLTTIANMTSENADIVDETPISPVRSLDRRNSLEKHLQHRPEPQDLKNRHILLDTTTAPYVSKALEKLHWGGELLPLQQPH
jgi:hypothetical protein